MWTGLACRLDHWPLMVINDALWRLITKFARRPRPVPPADGALAQLTGREREVLEQVAADLSNAEIAANLHLSIATVKTHVSWLLTKLNGRDRAQLIVIAYLTGVASPGQHHPDS